MREPPRVYIAGPMTGLPEYNVPAFNEASESLRLTGHLPLNPARRGVNPSWTWLDYMRAALRDIADADGVAFLDGWECSRGANIEVGLARDLGIPANPLRWWLR